VELDGWEKVGWRQVRRCSRRSEFPLFWIKDWKSPVRIREQFQASAGVRKPRGTNPTNAAEAAAKGRTISAREADRFARAVLPIIASIQRSGITSLRGLTIALTNRGVPTARNGEWQVSNVRNLLARSGA
jgi:hypothetical protein